MGGLGHGHGHGHHHGGHGWHGGGFRRGGAPVVFLDDSDDYDDGDPHDQLLLTDRPVTVVTQATNLLDNMPAPFEDEKFEESLFAGIGLDDGATRKSKLAKNRKSIQHRVPGIMNMWAGRGGMNGLAADVAPAPTRSLAADMLPWGIAAVVASVIFFGGRKRK